MVTTKTRWLMAATILCTVAGSAGARGIESAVQTAAERVLPPELAITDITVPKSLPWPKGAVASIEWRAAPRPGRINVMLAVYTGEKVVGQGWAQIDIARVREVVVVQKALRAGDPVMLGDLTLQKRPVRDDNAWQVDPTTLVGSIASRDVAAGEILTKTAVTGPPPIARGTGVEVVARRGAVVVSTRGTLERTARPGEPTSARTAAGLLVKGRLVGDGRVLMVDGGDR